MTTVIYVFLAVGVASLGNYLSAVWASDENTYGWSLAALILVSPVVFITFGLVVRRTGLAVAAGTVDTLLTATTIVIGLIIFREWAKITPLQYAGIGLAVSGMCLMLFAGRHSA
ncbi:hypothetical protein [Terricaulis sp.]|uniref:hypothetical protein n=1 Tax=Terricaulis sp. TaxID=2768686 RepID=UPI002ADDC283|nr:hypothetical protein [Terricaulis sp.]